MQHLTNLARQHLISNWPWWLAVIGFLSLTLIVPSAQPHWLYNLEPYPDGLFYVLPAWRWAQGLSFSVTHSDLYTVPARILPLYSLILGGGYRLWSHPVAFYGVNVGLGLVSLAGLNRLFRQLKVDTWAVTIGLLTYLAHLIIVWLPSVPMAENLGLPIFIWAMVLVLQPLKNTWQMLLTAALIGSLVFIKYTFIGPVIVLGSYLGWKLWRQHHYLQLSLLLTVGIVMAALLGAYQVMIGFNPTVVLQNSTSGSFASASFYGWEYILPNIFWYAKSLIGWSSRFLWLNTPLTSLGVMVMAIVGVRAHQQKLLPLIFISQFLLLIPFYSQDTRYLILSLPLIAIGVALFVDHHKSWSFRMLACFLIFLNLVLQRQLLRQMLAANWGGRSQAWQYQAVKTIDQTLEGKSQTSVITALPPLLFDIYTQANYRLLPLSSAQEFLDKGEPVWGSDIGYEFLPDYFHQQLEQGREIYVSNAYLTAEPEFNADFQMLTSRFNVQLVNEGCLQTCNVYRLQLK